MYHLANFSLKNPIVMINEEHDRKEQERIRSGVRRELPRLLGAGLGATAGSHAGFHLVGQTAKRAGLFKNIPGNHNRTIGNSKLGALLMVGGGVGGSVLGGLAGYKGLKKLQERNKDKNSGRKWKK